MKKRTKETVDYEALARFRREIRRFLSFSHDAAQAAGIEPQQHQALLALRGRPRWAEMTVGALAEQLQIVHHSAVELSRRLEANGWIRRSRSALDGRQVLLLLSERGEKLLEKLSVSHRNELRIAAPKLIEALRSAIGQSKKPRTRRAAGTRRRRK